MQFEVSLPQAQNRYRASKWIAFQMLLTRNELEDLFNEISAQVFCCIAKVDEEKNLLYHKESYLSLYTSYLEALKSQNKFLIKQLLISLNVALAYDESSLYKVLAPNNKCLIKIKKPCIQVKPFNFVYHFGLEKFLTNIKSEEAIYFGLEFSFPQIFQDPQSQEIQSLFKNNLSLSETYFNKIRLFVREKTKPAKFLISDKRKVATFRIGKTCAGFVEELSFLKEKQLVFIGK